MVLCCRNLLTVVAMSTMPSFSTCSRTLSMVMSVPVRPTPALCVNVYMRGEGCFFHMVFILGMGHNTGTLVHVSFMQLYCISMTMTKHNLCTCNGPAVDLLLSHAEISPSCGILGLEWHSLALHGQARQ